MPEPSIAERLSRAATRAREKLLTVPGFRPANLNGETVSEFSLRAQKGANDAGKSFAEAHPELADKARGAGEAFDNLRTKTTVAMMPEDWKPGDPVAKTDSIPERVVSSGPVANSAQLWLNRRYDDATGVQDLSRAARDELQPADIELTDEEVARAMKAREAFLAGEERKRQLASGN